MLFANPFVAMAATEATQKKSLGERMMTALLNTVMGILIVFIVLLLIAWIISLFKYINKFEANQAAKKAAQTPMPAEWIESTHHAFRQFAFPTLRILLITSPSAGTSIPSASS